MVLTTENVGELVGGKTSKREAVKMADNVRATSNVAAGGRHYAENGIYQVGKDITPQHASELISLGRMVPAAGDGIKVENREKDLAKKTATRAPAKKQEASRRKAKK